MIKFVSKDLMIENEGYQNIVVTESKSFVKEYLNPKIIDGKINIDINNVNEIDYRYIQIISKIKDKSIVEYASYDSIFIKKSNVLEILLVISVCLLVIAVAIFLFYKFCPKQERNLRKKVENAAFEGNIIIKENNVEELEESMY